mmetsp:Transcript_98514/g.278579  ORF Transcript_98514/g.278579 Transcript_98514/m.278579 type:complete len:205 (+) Transcript_98514:124-738(+)
MSQPRPRRQGEPCRAAMLPLRPTTQRRIAGTSGRPQGANELRCVWMWSTTRTKATPPHPRRLAASPRASAQRRSRRQTFRRPRTCRRVASASGSPSATKRMSREITRETSPRHCQSKLFRCRRRRSPRWRRRRRQLQLGKHPAQRRRRRPRWSGCRLQRISGACRSRRFTAGGIRKSWTACERCWRSTKARRRSCIGKCANATT